jgi:formamidopyrimidine-DNA glycosylase
MPELPEVEITRQKIGPLLLGRRIAKVATTGASYFFLTPPARLAKQLAGRQISDLDRRGKYLCATLDDGSRFVIHLGMTGQLFSSEATSVRLLSATARASLSPEQQAEFQPDPHTHLQFFFEDGGPKVYLRDVRKFGKVLLLSPGEDHPRLQKLGIDALEFNGFQLFDATRNRKIPIKALLLDQAVVAGVGNIYADEALFLAGVRPGRCAARVTKRECDEIVSAVQQVLLRSIETGGSSITDFVGPDGRDGAYQDERRVYARTGCPCHVCRQPIRKKVIAQRGTHYCPGCQR